MPGMINTITFFIFFLLVLAVTGGITYRGRGGPLLKLPRPTEQMLFCSFLYAAGCLLAVPFLINFTAYALAVAACCTGHGQYFLSMAIKALEPERFDFLLRPFFGRDPRDKPEYLNEDQQQSALITQDMLKEIEAAITAYGWRKLYWRCISGMAITGGAVTLAPGIAAAFYNLWAGITIAVSGFIIKPLAYAISDMTGHSTEGGEWGFGAAVWPVVVGTAAVAWFLGMVCI